MRFLLLLMLMLLPADAGLLRDLPYAGKDSHPLQTLDLYLPAGAKARPRPVFILVHGGGWSMGDKAHSRFVEPKASWLLQGGYLVASVNYRLAPAVKHPGPVEDLRKAMAWLRKHAGKYGGDPSRLYLLGHSAGAHLAALAAVDAPRLEAAGVDPAAIRGVVLLDGAGYDLPLQYAGLREDGAMRKLYRNAFTADPEKQRDASPVHRVAAKPPPFLILHVARRAGSRHQAGLLAGALRGKGGRAKVLALDKTHATISADCGKDGDPVTLAIAAFLRP